LKAQQQNVMEKLELSTPNFTDENVQKLSELFPNCVTESSDGKVMDFDALRQELSSNIIEGNNERYQLTWPGKAESLVAANAPINKTLRPHRKESKDFDNTENLYIEGDNLEVLKLLQETYLGKIKMIYIDPPYNTGKDFVYKDNYAQGKAEYDEKSRNVNDAGGRLVSNPDSNGRYHSDWLSMMYPRLKLARNLLKDDGVIFISIDDNELANLQKVCDELFGKQNFVCNFVWRKKAGGGNDSKDVAVEHEYIVVYRKQLHGIYKLPLKKETIASYKMSDEKINTHGRYKIKGLNDKSLGDSSGLHYDIECPDGSTLKGADHQWKCNLSTYNLRKADDRIVFNKSGEGAWRVYYKLYLNEEKGVLKIDDGGNIVPKGRNPESILYTVGLNKVGNDELKAIFGNEKPFDYPKPTTLIKHFILMGMKRDDILLDFFSGSGTTAHSVMQLNVEDGGRRKYICVQIPEPTDEKSTAFIEGYKDICEVGRARIKRAGEKIKEDNSGKEGIKDLDSGFRVLKVDSSNMKDVYFSPDNTSQEDLFERASNIKDDRTDEDLLFMVLLDWGIDLSVKIERREIAGKTVYFADDNFLAACFENNLDEDFAKALAAEQPRKVVLRDSGFAGSSVKINIEQIFKQPGIEGRVI
jgi:adenine-specific DNA-methyltransferase